MMGLDRFVELDRLIIRISIPTGFDVGKNDDDYNKFISDISRCRARLLGHDSVGYETLYLTFLPDGVGQEEILAFCRDVFAKHLIEIEEDKR